MLVIRFQKVITFLYKIELEPLMTGEGGGSNAKQPLKDPLKVP